MPLTLGNKTGNNAITSIPPNLQANIKAPVTNDFMVKAPIFTNELTDIWDFLSIFVIE